MNILVQPPKAKLEPRQRFVLWNAGWDTYEKIVDALNELHVRVTYDRGDIELMSPLPIHEAIKVWFGHFILALAMELNLPFRQMGSPTLRRQIRDRGLEPDDCFYFTNIAKVADWATLNLDCDPPPDLALEVDVTSSSLDRLSVYAGLSFPEVWRYDEETWHVHLLDPDGNYQEAPCSAIFPYLPIPEIMPLMRQSLYIGDVRERLDILRHWVRERVLPLYQTWPHQQQSPPAGANP